MAILSIRKTQEDPITTKTVYKDDENTTHIVF